MSTQLVVRKASKDETYQDMVRIPEDSRKDWTGKPVDEGEICSIALDRAGGRSTLVIVRGVSSPEATGVIQIDEVTRRRIGLTKEDVENQEALPFVIQRAGTLGQIRWAWTASNPSYRVPARVAVLSAALTVIGVILAAIAIFLVIK